MNQVVQLVRHLSIASLCSFSIRHSFLRFDHPPSTIAFRARRPPLPPLVECALLDLMTMTPQQKPEQSVSVPPLRTFRQIHAPSSKSVGLLNLNLNLSLGDMFVHVLPCRSVSPDSLFYTAIEHNARGYVLFGEGDARGALSEFRKAERLSRRLLRQHRQMLAPNGPTPDLLHQRTVLLYNFGVALCVNGRPRLALESFHEAIQQPSHLQHVILNGRGVAYMYCSRFTEALDDFNTSLHYSCRFATAMSNRALVFCHRREWESAIAEFERAVQCDQRMAAPAWKKVQYALAQIRRRQSEQMADDEIGTNDDIDDEARADPRE